MKRSLLLIAVAILLFGSSCKKTENNYYGDKAKEEIPASVKPQVGEKLLTTKAEIEALNGWYVVDAYVYDVNNTRVWKLKSGDNVVMVLKAPLELFWNPRYAKDYKGADKGTFTGKEAYDFATRTN